MTVRSDLKSIASRLLERRPVRTGAQPRVVVLCYHSVHPRKSFASATPELFDEHLRWLKANCEVVPFGTVLDRAKESHADKPIVAITFDDGYSDNFEFAMPVLLQHQLPATFFINVGLVEKDPMVVEGVLLRRRTSLNEIIPLTWDEIRSIHKEGMEVGSHTWSHANLAQLTDRAAFVELLHSRTIIEDRLQTTVSSIAYPFGKPRCHWTSRTLELAADAGYKHGASVLFRGVRAGEDPLAIPRFLVGMDSVKTLSSKVRGNFDVIASWQERVPTWIARRVSPVDFQRWDQSSILDESSDSSP